MTGDEGRGSSLGRAEAYGPISGGGHGWPFAGYFGDIGDRGYVEEEWFLSGAARRYEPVGELGPDGFWVCEPGAAAPYRTRLIVQRPADPARFNGTVVVEWSNVSSGFDVLVQDPAALIEAGFAYVAVSAQFAGVHGLPSGPKGLTVWDPDRYGSLVHPGDAFSYDIYAQAGQAVGPGRALGDADPLAGLAVERVIATGSSQSSWRLAAYANAVHAGNPVYDAIMLTAWRGVASRFDDEVIDLMQMATLSAQEGHRRRGIATRIRSDLAIPVMVVNSEGETLFHAPVDQPDTDRFRLWEVTGASHFPQSMIKPLEDKALRDFGAVMPMPADMPQSRVTYLDVLDAATVHVDLWLRTGTAPPVQPRIDIDSAGAIIRDARGIARGGARLPEVDAPIARNDGSANGLMGVSEPFEADTLRRLYPSRQAYVAAVTAAAAAAERQAIILPRAAADYVRAAETADIPPTP